MKKFLSLALAVLMLAVMLPVTALAAEPSGSIERAAITHADGNLKNAVSVDLKNVTFAESVAVKLYRGDTLLTTATLKTNVLAVDKNHPFVTCCIPTEGEDDAWSLTSWTPRDNVVPNKVVLFVDDNEMDTMEFTLNAAEWKALPGTYGGSIERAGITHANGVLKNAVSVDLKDVTFKTSVQVKLYSGDTLLTTATLNTGVLAVDKNHPFVTCCIPTEGEDAAWSLTSWTPKDDVVPNKVVLFVDDNEMGTMEFTLNAAEWKALPGTVRPSSGTIVITTPSEDTTPKTEDQKNPSTGANDVVAAAVALMAVSALGMAVLTRKK